MKKLYIVVSLVLLLAAWTYGSYRYIMCNLHPYYAEDGFLYIDFMGQVDTYYAEPLFEEE